MTKIALDKTDRKILSILQADGRLSNQDVAEQVALSPSPCLRRIKRLEEAGVIRQYVALLDPDKIGLGLLAYVNVRLEKHSEAAAHSNARALGAPNAPPSPRQDFAESVGQWPEVVACYAMTGDMDFLLHIFAPDLANFSDFALKALLRMPGVKGSRSSFIMQAVKSDLAWAPLPRLK